MTKIQPVLLLSTGKKEAGQCDIHDLYWDVIWPLKGEYNMLFFSFLNTLFGQGVTQEYYPIQVVSMQFSISNELQKNIVFKAERAEFFFKLLETSK